MKRVQYSICLMINVYIYNYITYTSWKHDTDSEKLLLHDAEFLSS